MKKACLLLLLLPTSAFAQTWDWMRKSDNIEDRRAWQAPVPFVPKIYLKERWWLEPQADPLPAMRVAENSVVIRPVYKFEAFEPLPPKFDTPSWVPDEATKKRALQRGYELNGNKMCCGSIDVSQDPVVTGRTAITPETEFNVLDATSVIPEKEKEKKKHK